MQRLTITPTRNLRRRVCIALIAISLLTWSDGAGSIVQAAGTDATFVDYAQCANDMPPSVATNCPGGWINGTLNANNSHYREDDVTPQRLEASLPVGGLTVNRTLTLTYLARKSGVHAYDYLARWNYTQTTADRCQGLAVADCIAGAASIVSIPPDPTVVADNGGPGSSTALHQVGIPQEMWMYGGTIDTISVPSHDNAGMVGADDTVTIVVTYHVASLPAKVQLLFGGHVAASFGARGWGANLGAASIPGSAYHIKWTMADTSSIGNRDNQIQAGALKASPTLNTTPNPTSGQVPVTLNDSATLAGGNQPGGTITFNLYPPGNTSCTSGAVYTQTVTVSGNGTYSTSPGYPATVAGTYRWTASYSGDFANNPASSSCNAEQVTLTGKSSPTITTTPNPSSATVGQTLNDSASLSGGSSPTGSIAFRLFAPSDPTCAGAPAYTETVTVSGNGTYATSVGAQATQTGTYHWTATYSGDGSNNSAASTCASEPVTVGQATPSITTSPNPTSATVGQTLNDSATLSSGFNPTGTITFNLYPPGNTTCTSGAVYTQIVTVSGNGTYSTSPGYQAAVTGTYRWTASYSGDANNAGAASGCDAEQVTSSPATPTITTSPSPSSATVGQTLNDSATLANGFNPTGTITFNLYPPGNTTCIAGAVYTQTVAVSGNGTYSTSPGYQAIATGTYRWTASYSGDANNAGAASGCDAEQVSSSPATPTITTTPSPASATVGQTLNDSAALANGFNPTGTITFNLYPPGNATCTAGAVYTQTVVVSGNGTYSTSPGYQAIATGTYRWTASYSGDLNNASATSGCDAEQVTSSPATPTITTSPNPPSATVGAILNDSATLANGFNPTGTITFNLYPPGNTTCTAGAVYTQTVPVTGNGTYSTSPGYPSATSGTYRWTATYGGDANNTSVTSGCDAEEVTSSPATPTITTSPTPPSATVGQTLNDSATLSGGFNPSGTITFNLYPPGNTTCTTGAVYTQVVAVSGNGTYSTSPGYQAIATGTYRWTAIYSGDGNNGGAASGCDAEQVTSSPASPTITTSPDPSSATVGATLNDSATLSGGFNPTGTITFNLYQPSDTTCSSAPLYTQTVTVSGAGTYSTSPGYPTAVAGTYRWTASYSGDANNNGAASGCDAEPVTVNPATPTVTTSPNPSSATVGAMLNDSATLSGGFNPTGTITFNLYPPGNTTCIAGAVYTQTVPVSGNGTYSTSPGYPSTATGTYHWTASYSGDINNTAAASGCEAEPVTSNPATPSITTSPDPSSTTVGGTLNDSATLADGFNPTGTITFNLYPPGNTTCTAGAVYTQAVPVSGNGTYSTSPGYPAATPGTYRWTASYSGDLNNAAATSGCDAEQVTSNQATPSIATTPDPSSATVGAILNDSATLSGGFNPTGTITFNLYPPGNTTCTAGAVYTQTVPVSGNGTYSTSPGYPSAATGTYRWTASYSGDPNNTSAGSGCDAEQVTISAATPSITTTPDPSSATVGATLNDSATLSGGFNPTGTITFNLYPPGNTTCTAGAVYTQAVPVSGNGNYSTTPGYTTTAPGTYRWTATYSGDGNNSGATSGCDAEQVTVEQATPSIATSPNPTSATVGAMLNDSATLSGGFNPTGSITFNLYPPGNTTCTAGAVYTQIVPVSGNGAYSTSPGYTTTAPGTYRWTASYSGDPNNATATSGCNAEQVTVNQATPSITTTPNPSSATVGQMLNDSASLSSGFNPTGTITFNLYPPGNTTCTSGAVYTQIVPVSGNGSYATAPGYATTSPGTYRWTATYSGDGNNSGATSGCDAEQVTVSPAAPSITTTPNPSSATVGQTLNDSATLSGAFNPTGTITFNLYPPGNTTCTSGAVYTQTVVVSSNGTYSTSPGYVATAPGTYRWTASYSGDPNNTGATSGCNAEQVSVSPAAPSITTTPNPSSATVGATLNDSATLSGGFNPTGTITFNLYPPGNTTCTSGAVYTQTVPVSGNGNYGTTPGYTTTAPGTYRWTASYSGDANNASATSGCNAEQVTVNQATPAITTNPNPSSATTGQTLNDSATLSAGYNPTGTITFNLYPPGNTTCTAGAVYTQAVPVSGNGTYNTSPGYVATTPGTYRWTASYSGDANNASATSGCNAEQVTVTTPPSPGFMTGGGQVIGSGGALVTFGGNASGTPGGVDAKGHFNILNHSTKEHYEGDVTAILDVNPTTHEMTFCFTTKTGTQYTVTWRDNGEPGNTGAGTSAANADKLTLRTGCSLVGPILWGVVVDPLLHGNVQWHDQGR